MVQNEPEFMRVARKVHALVEQMQIGEGPNLTREQRNAIQDLFYETFGDMPECPIPNWQQQAVKDLLEQAPEEVKDKYSGTWRRTFTETQYDRYHITSVDTYDMEVRVDQADPSDATLSIIRFDPRETPRVLAFLLKYWLIRQEPMAPVPVELDDLDDHPF